MERTSIDPRRPRPLHWLEECKSLHQHNAEYLHKLAKLRDELINQEQTNLANALDRLRQRHNANGLQRGYRPRDTQHFLGEPVNRKSFVTTLEQFRRTRPQKSPPRIMPLEGKQLMEPNIHNRSTNAGDKDTSSNSVGSARSADESFRLNLQRLIQPTSSIPNIGRKSNKPNKHLVLQSSPLQKKDYPFKNNPIFAVNNAQDRVGLYKNLPQGSRIKDMGGSHDLNLSPHSIHYGSSGDQDRMNVDKLKDYYCVYYLPPNTPVRDDDSTFEGSMSITSSRKSDCDITNKHMLAPIEGRGILKPIKSKRSHPKGQYNENFENKAKFRMGTFDSPVHRKFSDFEGKRRIVVDMPCIVFNSASPDISGVEDNLDRENTVLLKTYKQNQLRQREVKNLMEDVKELNMRNEHLTENYCDA